MFYWGKVEDDGLVHTTLDGLPSTWETFVSGINARENQLSFDRLWTNCLQEEGRILNKSGPPSEENLALVANARKGRGRRFPSTKDKDKRPDSDRERRQKDM